MKIKIGKIEIDIQHKYMFSKDPLGFVSFRTYELGLWFRKNKTIREKNFSDVSQWKSNLVNTYSVGLNLIVFKFWIAFSRGAKHFNTKDIGK